MCVCWVRVEEEWEHSQCLCLRHRPGVHRRWSGRCDGRAVYVCFAFVTHQGSEVVFTVPTGGWWALGRCGAAMPTMVRLS